MEYLANLWSADIQNEATERAIAGRISWLSCEMTHPSGFFYTAQDADNFVSKTEHEPEEGEFYVWQYDLLQRH